MKTTTQEKKTDFRKLGFTEITNPAVIIGGNTPDDKDKSEIGQGEEREEGGEGQK